MLETNDKQLVRECLNGNRQAFAKLVEKYQRPMFNAALLMVKDSDDAKDITQTVFLKTYEKLNTFDPQYEFFSWIYRMLVNESINWMNRSKRFTELDPELPAEGKSPEDFFADKELAGKLDSAVGDLSIDNRMVIVLRHFADLSYQELGFVLDLPEKTIKSRLFSARRQLCKMLLERGVTRQ